MRAAPEAHSCAFTADGIRRLMEPMTRMMHRYRHRLASLLAGVWLLVSNAALCLALPAPVDAHSHLPQANELHPDHDPHAGHHGAAAVLADTHETDAHSCCAQPVMPPCCADASVAPAFGVAWAAQLALAPPPAEPFPSLAPLALASWPESRDRPPRSTGPPTYIRCCSLLI